MTRLLEVGTNLLGLVLSLLVFAIVLTVRDSWVAVDPITTENVLKTIFLRHLAIDILLSLGVLLLFLDHFICFARSSTRAIRWSVLTILGVPGLILVFAPLISLWIPAAGIIHYQFFMAFRDFHLVGSILLGLAVVKSLSPTPQLRVQRPIDSEE